MSHDTPTTTDAPAQNDSDDSDGGDEGVVVQPDAGIETDDTIGGSPLEKARSALDESIHRDFTAADDDHPLVQTAGSKEALRSSANASLIKELSDGIYAEEDVFFREWAQNHIAAVVRGGRRRVKNAYGMDALYREIEHDHEWNDSTHTVRLPQSSHATLEAAKELGYIPTIEFVIDHDDGRIRTRDNGIGMTTGEVIGVWNEPSESGSRTDFSTAGTKGLGALTWINVSGEEGGAMVTTRTRREETLNGANVPDWDREGFTFFSYLGGVLPVTSSIEDGFYGTEFSIPIRDDLDPTEFEEKMAKYTTLLPVQISWYEIEGGERTEEEFEAARFGEQYDDEPNIFIDRPGEFRVALDNPGNVGKSINSDTTYLLDNPIDRNEPYSVEVDTLWNDHIQVLNENGLIVAGPNRGELHDSVQELEGSLSDIRDPEQPMPDVPLPQPTTSRDQFQQGEAMERFITYISHLATQEEIGMVHGYLNDYLDCDSTTDALEFVRDRGSDYDLFVRLVNHHGKYNAASKSGKLMDFMDSVDAIDFTLDDCDLHNPDDDTTPDRPNKSTHPDRDLIEFLTGLQDEVDVFLNDPERLDPDKKANRANSEVLGELITTGDRWPVFVGATLNQDRVRVLLHDDNHPDALVIKSNRYTDWRGEPWNAGIVKNVPFTQDAADEADGDWTVTDEIDAKHVDTPGSAGSSVDVGDEALRVRCRENSAVDIRLSVDDFTDALDSTGFGATSTLQSSSTGNEISGHRWTVVFGPSGPNISAHYDLSPYANIVNVKAAVAEELLSRPSVFTLDEFEAFLADTRLPFYVPETGAYNTARVDTLTPTGDTKNESLVLHTEQDGNLFSAVLFDNDHALLPDSGENRRLARSAVFEKLKSGYSLRNPLDDDDYGVPWRVVRWGETGSATHARANAYWSLYAPQTDDPYHDRVDPERVRWMGRNTGIRTPNVRCDSPNKVKEVVRYAQYPAWENDSDAWDRLDSTYRGPKEYERSLLRACRELGVDPTKVEPDRLEQLVVMLATTCPEN